MNCPLCVEETLDVTHHGGIEIDICPRCRGIWLDRHELDRLMGSSDSPDPSPRSPRQAATDRHNDGWDSDDEFDRPAKGGSKKNKKRRFMDKLGDALEEVLDL